MSAETDERVGYLSRVAGVKKAYRDGLIDRDTYRWRLVQVIHQTAGVDLDVEKIQLEIHADQAMRVLQDFGADA